jgi:hypothetical protein
VLPSLPAWTWLTDKAPGVSGGAENSFGESTQGLSHQMLPPSSRQETLALKASFRVTGAYLTLSTPFCAAHGGVDQMAGSDLSKNQVMRPSFKSYWGANWMSFFVNFLIFRLKIVQKYRKLNSQKRVLELSKLFLNEMRDFFRFTRKRKTEFFFQIRSIVSHEILRCVALFKKLSKKRKKRKTLFYIDI